MKIYQVTAYDNAFMWFFYATKGAAERAARKLLADMRESWPDATAEVETLEVAPTRAGIVQALTDFTDITCINEH